MIAKPKRTEAPFETYQHLLTALGRVSDAVITTTLSGHIVFMNTAAEAFTHCTLSAAVGKTLSSVLSIVDPGTGEPIDVMELLTQSRKPTTSAALLESDTDDVLKIDYTVSPLAGPSGACDGALVIFRMARTFDDAAGNTAAPERFSDLPEESERAQVTLNSIGDAVISTDFRGRVTFLNAIAEKLTGWPQSDARGRPLEEVFSLVDSTSRQPVLSPAMQAIIENEKVDFDTQKVLIRRDGAEIAVHDSTTPIHDEQGGVVGAVLVAQDVTAAREEADRLVRLALYDPLTGLPNRTLLKDRLTQAIERAHRQQGTVALLFIDLDGFKLVNDHEGHAMGDELLQQVAERLCGCIRASDTICRYGGDEFIVMLTDLLTADDAATCGAKILNSINLPFRVNGTEVKIGASIGIASYPLDTNDPDVLIKRADSAMYQAKADGRNNYRFYSQPAHLPA